MIRRAVLGQILIIIALLEGTSLAGERAELHFIGFSEDGRHLAFEQYGTPDTGRQAFSEIIFVDVPGNQFIQSPNRLEKKGPVDSLREENRRKTADETNKLGITEGNTGLHVVSRPIAEMGVDPHKVEFFAPVGPLKPSRRSDSVSHEVSLQEVRAPKGCTSGAHKEPVMLELAIATFARDESGNTRRRMKALQEDFSLPSWRCAAVSYRIRDVYIYRDNIAVFISVLLADAQSHRIRHMVVTGVVAPAEIPAVMSAVRGKGPFDIFYFEWTPAKRDGTPRDATLDHMGALEEVLSDKETMRLEVVARQGEGRKEFGVIYSLGKDRAGAEAIASEHGRRLRKASGSEEALAKLIPSGSYYLVYNVSYGLGKNLADLRRKWRTVAVTLGPGVAKRLFIEQTDYGNFALVYKRYGDKESTANIARRHRKLLKRKGLDASVIQERYNQVVWDGSSAPTPPKPPPKPPPEPPAPPAPPHRRLFALNPGRTPVYSKIQAYIGRLRRRGKLKPDERTAWLVYDLKQDRTLANINGSIPLQCASMVKPLVMLAFFDKVARGRLTYGPESRRMMRRMIQRSSNRATDWVIDRVGGPKQVQAILRKRYGHLLPKTVVVEKMGRFGRTFRNKASAEDYARFLRALWRKKLPHSNEMLHLMNLPGRDRLYHGAPHIPPGTTVYNKTGTTSRLCGDMGILVAHKIGGGKIPYILVGIIEKQSRARSFTRWIRRRSFVIRKVSDMAYLRLRQRYDLE